MTYGWPRQLWSWLTPVFSVSDEELLKSAGLDALVSESNRAVQWNIHEEPIWKPASQHAPGRYHSSESYHSMQV